MTDIKISIIVPVNNVEVYLPKALESILNQTIKEIEIICVNDASTDSSKEVLQSFANKDNRVKIYDLPEKKGQSHARNYGIKKASGEYLGFVDGDDWVDIQMFEKMYSQAKKLCSDIVMCSTAVYDEHTQTISKENKYYDLNIFDESFDNRSFSPFETREKLFDINVAVWNKLYKRDFVEKNGFAFREGYIYEDLIFFFETYLKAEKVSLVKDFLYFYRINRPNSTMSLNKKKILDRIDMVMDSYFELKNQPFFQEIQNKVITWLINDLVYRYSLVDKKYQKEFFFRLKKAFKNVDLSQIDPIVLKNICYYKDFLLIRDSSYEDCVKALFYLYNESKYVEEHFVSKHVRELSQKEEFYIQEMNSRLEQQKISLLKEKEQELRAKEEIFKLEIKNISKFFEDERNRLFESFSVQKKELETRFVSQKNDFESRLLSQKKYYETEINKRDKSLEILLSSQKQWFESEIKLKTEEQLSWFNKELALLRERYNNDFALQKEVYEKELRLKQEVYEKDLNLLKDWYESEITFRLDSQKNSYQSELALQRQKVQNELSFQKDWFESLILEQKNKFEKELAEQAQIYEKTVAELQSSYETKMEKLQEENSNALLVQENSLKESHESELAEKLSQLKSQLEEEFQEQLGLQKQTLEEEKFFELDLQSRELEDAFNSQLDEQKRQHYDELNSQVQYYENEIKTQLLSQQDWFEGEIDRRIAEVDEWHNSNLNEHLNNANYEFESRYGELKQDYDKLLASSNEEIRRLYSQIEEQKVQFDKDTKYLKLPIKALKKLKKINSALKNKLKKKQVAVPERKSDRPVVSVILPIYNVEKYLPQCLDSLLNQSLSNIEIICVNDGSKDSCALILDEYKQKDPRIKVLHKDNAGTGAARNDGLKLATGECISFVDPDDWIREHMFERLYSVMQEKDVDIVMCKPAGFDEGNQVEADFPYFVDANFQKELDNNIFNWSTISPFSYPMCVWNKLYKKELFDKYNIDFAEGLDFEDHKVIFKSLLTAKKMYFIREQLYVYRYNREGSILSDNNRRLIDHIQIFDIVEKILSETGTYVVLREDFLNYKIHNLLYYYSMIKDEHKEEYHCKMIESLKETKLTKEETELFVQKYPELSSIVSEI